MKIVLINPNCSKLLHGSEVHGWRFVEKHGAHIWQGRELDYSEFNRVSDEIIAEATREWSRPIQLRMVPEEHDIKSDPEVVKANRQAAAARAREMRLRKLAEEKEKQGQEQQCSSIAA